jgi:hypothetical protein
MTTTSTQNFELQNFSACWDELTNSINVAEQLQGSPKIFFNRKLKTAICCFNESSIERRFRRLRNKLKANISKFYSFATFTISDVNLDKFDSNKEISRIMNLIQMHAKRKPPYEKLHYAWRVEFGKLSNRIHYHIFLSRFFPITELYSIWTNGYIDIKKIDSRKKALNYITKYFSKDLKPIDSKWSKANRLFGTSTKMDKYISDWKFDKNENLRYMGLVAINPKRWTYEKALECSIIIANLNKPLVYNLLSKNM